MTEKTENEELFEEEIVPEEQESSIELEDEDIKAALDDMEFGSLSNASAGEVVLADDDKDKIFEVESVELLKPKLYGADGFIEPELFNPKNPAAGKGYTSKVQIKYKDSNYVSILGRIRWYLNIDAQTKKRKLNPWFNTKGLTEESMDDRFTSSISKVYYLMCNFLKVEPGKLTQEEFVKKLVGKKVKLKQFAEKYQGKMGYRIDIAEIVE